ncbi:MAG: TlpA family protein disulfide reductase [Candidatus Krumholzibacteriia bacterium]
MTSVQRLLSFALIVALLPAGHSVLPVHADVVPGNDLHLESHRGSVVLVDFWASWCGPCRKSFPWMNEMHEKYSAEGLVIIAVNVDRDRNAAQAFLKKRPARFQVVYDTKGQLAQKYELEAMPSSFLYDREGHLVSDHLGFVEKESAGMEADIEALLHGEASENGSNQTAVEDDD